MVEEVIIKDGEFKKYYNRMLNVSYTDGVLLPVLFQSDNISNVGVDIEVSPNIVDKLEKLSDKRVESIDKILSDEDFEKRYDKLDAYYVKEVKDFIKKYPQFKSVVSFEEFE